MRSVGFFCAVFFSMLAVFLLATGEFKRWLFPGEDPYRWTVQLAPAPAEDGEKTVKFDAYNVELGRRSLSIRAEFDEEDFQVETQIEDLRELTLGHGVIEVPVVAMEGDRELDAPPRVKSVTLHFESALCKRLDSVGKAGTGDDRGEFQVVLRNGRGNSNDGTQFHFEELIFGNGAPGSGGKPGGSFAIRSTKKVWIRSPALTLVSPSGLRGQLRSHGLERLTFLPPVSAVVDPNQPSVLELGDSVGIQDPAREDTDAGATPTDARIPDTRVAVTCQGPLTLAFEEPESETEESASAEKAPGGKAPAGKTLVTFEGQVRLFTVGPETDVEALPAADGSRFECEKLELELQGSGTSLSPRRAVATHDGGEVRAVVYRGDGEDPYTISGEWLEWKVEAPIPGAEAADSGSASRRGILKSEAVLHGKPTLRGPSMAFEADDCIFQLDANRLTLVGVEGVLEHAVAREAKATVEETSALRSPELEPWKEEPVPVGGETLAEAAAGSKSGRDSRSALPRRWRMKADEAEFTFRDFSRSEVGQTPLTQFIARSSSPDGVVIESEPPAADVSVRGSSETAPSASSRESRTAPISVTGRQVVYKEAEKELTFTGTPEVAPRFTREADWIEAKRIHVLLREEAAWFDEDVRGRILNARDLVRQDDGTPGGVPGADALGFEVSAASLTIRRDGATGSIRDLWGQGAPGAPLVVRAAVANEGQESVLRFEAPELYWDQVRQIAQLRDPVREAEASRTDDGSSTGPGGLQDDSAGARVVFDGGDLKARQIQFHQRTWKVYLSDGVLVRVRGAQGDEEGLGLTVRTESAEVEFFPRMQEGGPSGEGMLRYLSRVKSLHATTSEGRKIEIEGDGFIGRATECAWEAESQELRFFGKELQEIEILRDDFHGPIVSREIVYSLAKSRVILRGDVQGRIVQSSFPTGVAAEIPGARVKPASDAGGAGDVPVPWHFDTSELQIQLRKDPATGSLGLDSVSAKDKILLRNDALRIQLRGDDLTYEEATRKIHIFSRDGRPQTLLCDRFGVLSDAGSAGGGSATAASDRGAQDAGMERVHKIGAQEIWVLLYENPYSDPTRGDPRGWLLVEFQRDVMASFYLPTSAGEEGSRAFALGDTWKMVADRLTLHIDPSQPTSQGAQRSLRNLIPWAVATGQGGKVVFSSGSYQATADRAIYEDPFGRLTLIGSPARLSQDSKTIEESAEILLRKVGGVLEYSPGGRHARPTVPRAPGLVR